MGCAVAIATPGTHADASGKLPAPSMAVAATPAYTVDPGVRSCSELHAAYRHRSGRVPSTSRVGRTWREALSAGVELWPTYFVDANSGHFELRLRRPEGATRGKAATGILPKPRALRIDVVRHVFQYTFPAHLGVRHEHT